LRFVPLLLQARSISALVSCGDIKGMQAGVARRLSSPVFAAFGQARPACRLIILQSHEHQNVHFISG
jgi:hypothetical protein